MDLAVYWFVRTFFALVAALPRTWARSLCRGLAHLTFSLDRRHRRIGLINLAVAFPQKDPAWRRRILKDSFLQLGDLAVELSRMTRLTADEVTRRAPYQAGFGLEHYRRARNLAEGGILFLTAHIGPWELLPVAHALHGYPLSFLVRPLDNPLLERWLSRVRTACGNEVIDKNQSIRKVLQRLREGRDVGFLIDQNAQAKDGVFAPFFGRPACTSSALAALALKTGAPVVPGFIHPSGSPGRYAIRFHPPIQVRGSGDRQRDLVRATTLFNRAIEEAIRESPAHWLWGHRRFQTQPDGRNPYA